MLVKEQVFLPLGNSCPRVLHLTSSGQIGGTERMLLRFLERCDRGKFQHSVAAMQPSGPLLGALERIGIEATGLPGSNPLNASVRGEFRAMLRTGDFALIHAYGLRADVLARGLAHRARVRAYVSAIRSPDPWRRFYHVWLDRWTARRGRVDLFISNSDAGRRSRIRREKFPPGKIITIRNGIDLRLEGAGSAADLRDSASARAGDASSATPTASGQTVLAPPALGPEEAAALRARHQLSAEDRPLVVVVSNLRRMKGHLDLIDALVELRGRFPRLRCLFVGRDDSDGMVEEYARGAGVHDRIVFCGFVESPLPLVRLADVYCMPSHWEGCPAALLEAMALGRPIVATHAGGIPELVRDGQEALLVPAGDPLALAGALAQLLENKPEAERLGVAACRRAREAFSLERMVKEIEAAYARLLT